jgi:hypothetical protein
MAQPATHRRSHRKGADFEWRTSGTRTCCSFDFPQEISATRIDTGAMAVTIMLQEYAALTNLVAQQPDRDTL